MFYYLRTLYYIRLCLVVDFKNSSVCCIYCFLMEPVWLITVMTDDPRFAEPIPNVTVALGRDASLPCVVENLGTYKVSD